MDIHAAQMFQPEVSGMTTVFFQASKALYEEVKKELIKPKAKGLKPLNTALRMSSELTNVPVPGDPQMSQTTIPINSPFLK